jgi:hypothetical protein
MSRATATSRGAWTAFWAEAYEKIMFTTLGHDDAQRAFFPSGLSTLFCKMVLGGWAVSCFVVAIVETRYKAYEMAYLTNWSLAITSIYFILSIIASLSSFCTSSYTLIDENNQSSKLQPFMTKSLTITFTIASVQQLFVTIFWLTNTMDLSQMAFLELYVIVVGHGPLALIVLLDGLVLNAIPVRARHITFVWILQGLYLLWTVIYSILDIKNPWTYMVDGNTDAGIYTGFLNWRLYPGKTLLFSLGFVFIITPITFASVWCLSYFIKKHQSRAKHSNFKPDVLDDTIKSVPLRSDDFTSRKGEDLGELPEDTA